jgi:nucleotide-binding universal stress UspA family protein
MTHLPGRAIDTLLKQIEWHPNAATTHRCAVAGFDDSYASRGALAYATGWAKRNLAGLVVVHVDGQFGQRITDAACAIAAMPVLYRPPPDFSAQVSDALSGASTPWAYLTASGDVAYQLEGIADALHADAIVIGHSRRGRYTLRGSVARRLVATSRRIVVVVP